MAVAGSFHLRCVSVKDCLIVCLVVLREDLVELLIYLVAVGLGCFLSHLDSAVRHEGTL